MVRVRINVDVVVEDVVDCDGAFGVDTFVPEVVVVNGFCPIVVISDSSLLTEVVTSLTAV